MTARRTTTFALTLPPPGPGTPRYRWLYEAVRAEILQGELGRVPIDPHHPPGVIEPARLCALDGPDAPQLLCRGPRLGAQRHPLAGAQALSQVDPAQILRAPHTWIGSLAAIADSVNEWRDRWGVSYFVVPENAAEKVAPLVQRLTGR